MARNPAVLNAQTVIGIATELYDPSGYSLDVAYIHLPSWSEEDERLAEAVRRELGILESPQLRHIDMAEFPDPQVDVTRSLGAPSTKKRPPKERRIKAKKRRKK
jgi:hypothetical protein